MRLCRYESAFTFSGASRAMHESLFMKKALHFSMQRGLRNMCFLGANLYLETRRSNERIEEKAARTRKRGNPHVTGFHTAMPL